MRAGGLLKAAQLRSDEYQLGYQVLPEKPLFDQRGLLTDRLPGQVDAALGGLEVGVPSMDISAAGDRPAAALFVMDVCRPSWNGRMRTMRGRRPRPTLPPSWRLTGFRKPSVRSTR